MYSNLNRELQFQLHPRDSCMDRQFTAIDFIPQKLGKTGIFSLTRYENFRSLVDRANNWLSANPYCKIVTCESVEFRNKNNAADATKMTYLEHGESLTSFLRGLRLWVEPSSETNHPIDYMNVLPQVAEKGGFFKQDTYDTIEVVVSRTNEILRTRPFPGRIITIENQEMKMVSMAQLDPDKTSWEVQGDSIKSYTFVVRIFYEKSNEILDQKIGVQDFVPNVTKEAGIVALPEYEPFHLVVAKASDWCSRQYGMKICNVQALNIKVGRGSPVDSTKMIYYEHGTMRTYFVRILRVNYVLSEIYCRYPPLPGITCKVFVPVQLTSGFTCGDYETLLETKSRVEEWVRVTGVQILNAETGVVPLRSLGKPNAETFLLKEGDTDQYWIFVIRLYIIGTYYEPPPGLLKPVPIIKHESCTLM